MAEPRKETSKNDQNEPAIPSSDDKAESGTQETASSKKSSPDENKKRFFDPTHVPSIIAGLMFLVNGGMLYYYCRLSQTTEKQVKIAEKSLNSSVVYSRRTVEIADSTIRIDNRAYMTVYNIVMDKPKKRNEKWQIDVWLVNSGKTPAHHVRTLARCDTSLLIYDKEILTIKQTIHRSMTDTISDMLVGPNQHVKINPTYLGVNPGAINWQQLLDSAKIRVFVYGYTEYVDIFRETHYLEFCQRYWPQRDFIVWKEHNNGN